MSSEVNEVWLVLFDDLRWRRFFRLPPDKVHLVVNCCEREARFHNQQHAAVKKKARAGQPKTYRNQVVTWIAGEGDDTDRDAGCYEHAKTQIEGDHTSLQYARAAGEPVQLLKNQRLAFGERRPALVSIRHVFQTI